MLHTTGEANERSWNGVGIGRVGLMGEVVRKCTAGILKKTRKRSSGDDAAARAKHIHAHAHIPTASASPMTFPEHKRIS